MLTTPLTTTHQYGSETDDVFLHETLSQSPSDVFVGLPPPPPPPPPAPPALINTCQILLPHQEVNLIVNRTNLTDIQARSIPSMFTSSNNIWTRCVLSNLRIQQTVFDQHFGETKSPTTGRYRRISASTSSSLGGDDSSTSLVLLDVTSKMLYDVPMRHLLQLVKKDYDDDVSIDHVIRAIDQAQMKSEWLDAVIALNKQFDKRPEDKARVLAHQGATHGLVLIEQFFVKLVRVPAYEYKLIYLKFREEAPTQLERMNKHIHDLLESIEVILTNEQLPGVLHLLCLLYNSITGKTIPGLHFDSILSVLSTRTLKQSTTIAHLLCHLLEEQYPDLLNLFENQVLLKLKDLSAIKYIPIYIDIRLLHTRYQQLTHFEDELIDLPEHMKTTLNELQILFTNSFECENRLKQREKDLANYFCTYDLSLETCLSTLGQFIDKLRLAHMQNLEQRRRHQSVSKPRSPRNSHEPYSPNIFRDHLNVPLTPVTARQRFKINRISRNRYTSSRDILHDEQQEHNSIPRKREHSPIAKNVLTKRPFNVLGTCAINKQRSEISDHERMDCSINESAIVPTTDIRNLSNGSNDQLIPIEYSAHSSELTTITENDSNEDEFRSQTAELTSPSDNPPVRAASIENLRSIPTMSALNRNVQRCAVSRRISVTQVREEIHVISSRSNHQSLTITGPLRALHMPTIITQESSVPRYSITMGKSFASRTVLSTVLPSSIVLKTTKNSK